MNTLSHVIEAIRVSQLRELQHLTRQFAIFTGWRPDPMGTPRSKDPSIPATPGNYPRRENKERNREITMQLEQMGYKWESISGGYDVQEYGTHVSEDSMLVYDISWDEAHNFAQDYRQESLIFKPRNGPTGIFATDGSWSGIFMKWDIGGEIDKGKAPKDYYTRFRRRGPFLQYGETAPINIADFGGRPPLWTDLARANPDVVQQFMQLNPDLAQEIQSVVPPLGEPEPEEGAWMRQQIGDPPDDESGSPSPPTESGDSLAASVLRRALQSLRTNTH